MNKQNLYVSFLNALLGVVMSLLLSGNLLIYGLICILLTTVIFIERRWIYEHIFKRKKWLALLGYGFLLVLIVSSVFFFTQPNRDLALIVKETHLFLDELKPGLYEKAYQELSRASQETYSQQDFVTDHEREKIKVEDFRIEGVSINEFDKNKAVIKVSSPFLIYGEPLLNLKLVKEGTDWKIAFGKDMMKRLKPPEIEEDQDPPGLYRTSNKKPTDKEKKRGAVTRFFKKLF